MDNQTLTEASNPVSEKTFEEVAKEVIRRSFRSAICIDNEYASAYSTSTKEGIDYIEPRELYYSFREQGVCDLDIFEFETMEVSWKDYMLENKDLMILDWELDPGRKFDSTIDILKRVVASGKIPFVVIYTNTPDIDSVAKELISNFNPVNTKQLENFSQLFFEQMSPITNDGIADLDSLKDESDLFFEYLHIPQRNAEAEQRILELLGKVLDLKPAISTTSLSKKVAGLIKSAFPEVEAGKEFTQLAYLVMLEGADSMQVPVVRIDSKAISYLINNTTNIMIFHKQGQTGGITPEKLFSEFAQTLMSDPHNFISLLALEMKDNFRENFSNIGAKFAAINEKAFLYHMGNYPGETGLDKNKIYEFILRSWVYELFQQKIGEKSDVLEFIDARYEKLEIAKITPDESLLSELVRYSAYISTTDLSYDLTKKLWFGDIFKNTKNEYFLCITPHCDCAFPSKIKKNYYFVKGTINNNTQQALENAEQGYSSFITDGLNPVCIDWKRKPFTSFVKDNTLNSASILYDGCNYELQYVTSLKENYTQRISNESFAYGYRVGIDLPHLPSASK